MELKTCQEFEDLWLAAEVAEFAENEKNSQKEISDKLNIDRGKVCLLLKQANDYETGADEELSKLFSFLRDRVFSRNEQQKIINGLMDK